MKIIKLVFLSFIILFLSHCGLFTFIPGGWEEVDNFKVSQDTKPSDLIKKYLGENYANDSNNYCLVFFDVYCAACYTQVNHINLLQSRTEDNFKWYAVTIYDTIAENNFRLRRGYYNDYLKYKFPTFYEINGLKSSLRNLHNNNVTVGDTVPTTIIIANDTIRRIINTATNTEEKYFELKGFLDSLSQNFNNLNEE